MCFMQQTSVPFENTTLLCCIPGIQKTTQTLKSNFLAYKRGRSIGFNHEDVALSLCCLIMALYSASMWRAATPFGQVQAWD